MFAPIDCSRFVEVSKTFHDGLNRTLRMQSAVWNPENDPRRAETIRWARLFVFRDSIRHLDRIYDMKQTFSIPPNEFDSEFVNRIFGPTVFSALDYAGAQNAVFAIVRESFGTRAQIPICGETFVPFVLVDELERAIEFNVTKLNSIAAGLMKLEGAEDAKKFALENPNAESAPTELAKRFLNLVQKYNGIEFTVKMMATEMGAKIGRCCTCFRQAEDTERYKGCGLCGKRVWCSGTCMAEDKLHICV